MTDRELADHLDAQDRLRARGWVKENCDRCKTLGEITVITYPTQSYATMKCYKCDGRGYNWKAPITK